MTGLGTPGSPGVLLVLDGWGHAPPDRGNALALARTPFLDSIRATCPAGLLQASGEAVGLLPDTVGNSETGHLIIGAGRALPYDSLLVRQHIDSGAMRGHPRLNEMCAAAASADRALHLVGLCSDGQIHSDLNHLGVLLATAAAHRVPRVWVHAITDGRDVADGTAARYLAQVERLMADAGTGRLATVIGRGYAMDKSGRHDLTEAAVLAMADGRGLLRHRLREAAENPERGDEWVPPSVLAGTGDRPAATMADQDAVLFFNFRSDRVRQLVDGLADHLERTGRKTWLSSLAQYDTRAEVEPLTRRAGASGGLADELERARLLSVRIAEREKFEHVTYYLNGRDPRPRATEEHVRVVADSAPDYRRRPQMGLAQVVDAVCSAATRSDVALVVANLANIDVVGHTGDLGATVRAAEHTDAAVRRIAAVAGEQGRWMLAVGDHGNAEQMLQRGPDGAPLPYGGHTTNPVPVVVTGGAEHIAGRAMAEGGSLADVAPTVLKLLGREPGPAMEGSPLL
ncbi:2,3-bisphosphoglycerate-independent phosphoglycerate mutase [Streptomyces chumphonensis]|uniref:2,3-bisphosphoglycerate-independent phosphoglycerate mutase n=1 Tax=Streptomyces chumphonensis TaxID=1214925 RepID=A0A927F5B8_9ACTN|nr:2,3-bisphosphoglycerate-independent phosphoglycerate mutase [Streptomyces chumphonensis]MBD3934429.1 2,3-bisphosphoglycerate-independent phosphoglycerate mutase [Streptomyces chumphonensis]